jgi:hypothetical protein
MFQSSCQKCGGPIPPPVTTPINAPPRIIAPPPAPRPIADNYAWKLVFSDGWAVTSLIFLFIGGMFFVVGGGLTLGIVTAFVGIPFLLLGSGFLAAGAIIFRQRFQKARMTVNVLREGQDVLGQITGMDMNYSVRVNGRHPWTIRYSFRLNGNNYEGQVTTLNEPNPTLKRGTEAYILYLPGTPENNALYPHP